MIGKKFNRFLVIARNKNLDKWLCRCDWGIEKIIQGNNLRRNHTKSCGCLNIDKTKERFLGRNNHGYIDGKHARKNRNLKEEVRKRNNYICQRCGKTQKEESQKLSVHHKDGDDTNNILGNMITYCNSCHRIVEAEIEAIRHELRLFEILDEIETGIAEY